MGKYQAYPEYKDSGVEWVGDIPAEWDVLKLKYIASIHGRIGFRGYTVEDIVDEGEGALVLSPSNVTEGNFDLSKRAYLSWQKYFESPEIMVEAGDVLLVKTGSTFGKSAYVASVQEPMTINPQMALLKNSILDARYLAYVMKSPMIRARIDISNTGSGMPTMTQENVNSFPIPFPANSLDIYIADFLDHETAKIDALIEKQQQLIQLLKEKRQAVISRAVTKGLNPNAPMKNSSIEWLGEVPAHWTVCRLKNVAKVESGHTPDKKVESYWVDCDIPWVSLNDSSQLKEVDYISETAFYLNEKGIANSSARKLPARSVVFTRDASIGLSAITTKIMAVSQHVIAWICDEEKVVPEFLLLIFYAMQDEFNRYTFGATLKTIGMADVNKLTAAFPSIIEQKEIVAHVFEYKKQLDQLMLKVADSISLIQERRTALISAAVTGKIDVRNFAEPATR